MAEMNKTQKISWTLYGISYLILHTILIVKTTPIVAGISPYTPFYELLTADAKVNYLQVFMDLCLGVAREGLGLLTYFFVFFGIASWLFDRK